MDETNARDDGYFVCRGLDVARAGPEAATASRWRVGSSFLLQVALLCFALPLPVFSFGFGFAKVGRCKSAPIEGDFDFCLLSTTTTMMMMMKITIKQNWNACQRCFELANQISDNSEKRASEMMMG